MPTNTPDLYYYSAMAFVHMALYQGLSNFEAERNVRFSWRIVPLFALFLATLYPIFRIYEIIPAFWWPGAKEHFNYWVGVTAAILGASFFFRVAFSLARRMR